MNVTIDTHSGFCFGVVHAIEAAERELDSGHSLFCLGDIVHNNMEVKRLKAKGLKVIVPGDLQNLKNAKVLIRAHGEPPETYSTALQNQIRLIDASCPVVLRLQNIIRQGYDDMEKKNGQIVIFGKQGHAEVNGLVGQTGNKAIIVDSENDLDKIDFSRPVRFFSQTTQSHDQFSRLAALIKEKMLQANPWSETDFIAYDTICRQVSHRDTELKRFAGGHEVILFVSGKQSSNGMVLFNVCKSVNKRTYLVSEPADIQNKWFSGIKDVGICGATSTPMWLMEDIARLVMNYQ